jgi:hypothetical protein
MKPFTKAAAGLLGVIAALHLYRLVSKFQLSAFGKELPLWANVPGAIAASILSAGLWKESCKKSDEEK